jgi:ornithine--oxo-acid transaminase
MSSIAELDPRPECPLDIASLYEQRESERYALNTRHMNEMMVRVLRTMGYNVGFCRGSGQYLFDGAGNRYLDLLSGWGYSRSAATTRGCARL